MRDDLRNNPNQSRYTSKCFEYKTLRPCSFLRLLVFRSSLKLSLIYSRISASIFCSFSFLITSFYFFASRSLFLISEAFCSKENFHCAVSRSQAYYLSSSYCLSIFFLFNSFSSNNLSLFSDIKTYYCCSLA